MSQNNKKNTKHNRDLLKNSTESQYLWSSRINTVGRSNKDEKSFFDRCFDDLTRDEIRLLLNRCFDDLNKEEKILFLKEHREKDLYYKIEACNDNLSIAIEHKNKKLKRCYDVCCFVPTSCCYICSLFMKICISSIFILIILFGIIMLKKIFI